MDQNQFKKEKSLNAILYIASKVTNPDVYKVLKLMYFADKYHLGHYGSLISDDSYVAMKSGPVPSLPYDILKSTRKGKHRLFNDTEIERFKEALEVKDNHEVIQKKEPDFDFFSESSLKSFDYAIENYGHLSYKELKKLSHDSAYDAADLNDEISVIEIAKTFDNSESLVDYLQNPYP